jgi:hypothetical protein
MDKLKSFEKRLLTAVILYNENLFKSINGRIDKTMRGFSIMRQLGNYGVILREESTPSETGGLNIKIAIVIDPPYVYICVSESKLDGVFIDYYSTEKYGQYTMRLTKFSRNLDIENTLSFYSDYYARLDGWNFTEEMIWS